MGNPSIEQKQGCGGCGDNNRVTKVSSLVNPKEKLGKCLTCITLSVFGTFLGWMYYFVYNETTSGYQYIAKYIFYVACFFSIFFIAHTIAFIVRLIWK